MDQLQVGSIYRHYKNQKLYKILAIGRHSEDHQPYVVYQGLYTSEEFGDLPIWVRPLSLFMGTVDFEGRQTPRFALQQGIS